MKRIAICADGTWDNVDRVDAATGKPRPTNVTKMARAILPRDASGVDQVVYYHDGVGTGRGLDKWTGGAFGDGIEAIVRTLYRFILYNYVPGDDLYLFGFSRGAFTVRTLAGFMNRVGLLQKDDDYFIPEAWHCYEQNVRPGLLAWTQVFQKLRDVEPCPPIHCIGVWDTVGELGVPGFLGRLVSPDRYKFHDISLTPPIRHAYQALAIDERRKPFMPSVWERPAGWAGELEQQWFAGSHSNVGGGYSPDGLANVALHWMVSRAATRGLAFDHQYLSYFTPCFNSALQNSMTGKYRFLGEHVRDVKTSLAAGAMLHGSVGDRMRYVPSHYAPQNVLDAFGGETPPGAGGAPCAPIYEKAQS